MAKHERTNIEWQNDVKMQLAARIAKNDIEKTFGGMAYTRVTKRGDGPTGVIAVQGVQVALVHQKSYGWTVSTFHPWFTATGEYVESSGSGIGNGFATKADAVAVAKAVIKADWN
jgi:hypothetical protein